MLNIIRLAGVLIILLTLSFPVAAQQQQTTATEKQALIKELLTTLDIKKNSDAIVKTMFDQMEREMPELVWQTVSVMPEIKRLTPDQLQKLREETNATMASASKRMRELFVQKIDLAKLTEEISAELYEKYFSESELKDLIAFHKSATGQKFLEVMPNFFAESMTKTRDRILPAVTELMNDISKEQTERIQKQVTSMESQPRPRESVGRKPQPRRRG
ncbi:MAG: DUF2059 domain-containing protein [Pyrinomonadaceae bacterium]